VEGSGTAAAFSGEAAIETAAAVGSKSYVPPAPAVNLVLLGMAPELVRYSVPASSARTSRHRYLAAVNKSRETYRPARSWSPGHDDEHAGRNPARRPPSSQA